MVIRKRFTGIGADAFMADTDRVALKTLKHIPLLPKVVRKFYEIGWDRRLYVMNMAMSVRCGPNQFKTLYGILREASSILDMPEPELYVSQNPFPNAFAGGVERPYITIRTSTIDMLNDDQLLHLIGHELGHIKAGHVLYRSVASILVPLLELVGRRTFGLGDVAGMGLVVALAEWYRQSEVTADRSGLLCTQNLKTSIGANLAMTAGNTRFANEMNQEAYMDQARTLLDVGSFDAMGRILLYLFVNTTATHPMPVHRSRELDRWANSSSYEKILAGNYATTTTID